MQFTFLVTIEVTSLLAQQLYEVTKKFGIMQKLPSSDPVLVPQSLPSQFHHGGITGELSSVPYSPTASEADKDWMDEEEWLLKGDRIGDPNVYGSSVGNNNRGLINDDNRQLEERLSRRKKGRRRNGRRLESTTVSSLTNIAKFFKTKNEDEESSDEEEPPIIDMIYRRSKKDLFKLIFLPVFYILLMGIAILFAFYTIQGLVHSYANRVRSVQQIDVKGQYHAIGIAVFPQFADYVKCEHRYYDDVSPNPSVPRSCNFQIPTICEHVNVTFNSTYVQDVTRHAMVFKGPTLVQCKESLLLRYNINTTKREFTAMEYILFDQWDTFYGMTNELKMEFLGKIERNRPIYTYPAGFRTWVKLSYSVREDFHGNGNYTEFRLVDNYASFSGNRTEIMPMEILFEWKTNYYDYIQEIVSTTAWNAAGSLCGLFLTLFRAGEFGRQWLRRLRRDREKKVLHLQKLEAEQKQLMESYEKRKSLRRETKLKKSLENTNRLSKIVIPE